MSDDRLQDLKRAWERSSHLADEVAYLHERVRVGDLDRERLELAAYCGHAAALEIASEVEANRDLLRTLHWLQAIFRHSIPISTQAALVLARVQLRAEPWAPGSALCLRLEGAVEAWLSQGTADARGALRAELEAVLAAAEEADTSAARQAAQALSAAGAIAEGHRWDHVPDSLSGSPPPKTVRAIRDAIRDELAPWLLREQSRR